MVNLLEAGQFKFELKEGDKVIETVTNAADGTVTLLKQLISQKQVSTLTLLLK